MSYIRVCLKCRKPRGECSAPDQHIGADANVDEERWRYAVACFEEELRRRPNPITAKVSAVEEIVHPLDLAEQIYARGIAAGFAEAVSFARELVGSAGAGDSSGVKTLVAVLEARAKKREADIADAKARALRERWWAEKNGG